MLEVLLTVDVEVWCDGWHDIDRKFPDAFRKYIHGTTPSGDFGLARKVSMLRSHGLNGVFFVEPLFATRFGLDPLTEVVDIIQSGRHEVQLHLHTEWVNESRAPILDTIQGKRQHLRYFNLEEQTILISKGEQMLLQAGVEGINAFRAGSFAFNRDTLKALSALGIQFDSSYNASMFGHDSGVRPQEIMVAPFMHDGVWEYPMTVFNDGSAKLRHAQLSACSSREIEGLLWNALESGMRSFVLLSHNFELLRLASNRPDWMAIKRFDRLCAFLDRNRDCFNVRGFRNLEPKVVADQPRPLASPRWKTMERMMQQVYRRVYG